MASHEEKGAERGQSKGRVVILKCVAVRRCGGFNGFLRAAELYGGKLQTILRIGRVFRILNLIAEMRSTLTKVLRFRSGATTTHYLSYYIVSFHTIVLPCTGEYMGKANAHTRARQEARLRNLEIDSVVLDLWLLDLLKCPRASSTSPIPSGAELNGLVLEA
jgi:hypothetical protein